MLRRKTVVAVMAVLPLMLLVAGCGEKPAPKKTSTTPPKIDEGKPTPPEGSGAKGKDEAQAAAVEGWGTIKGMIVYDGPAPEPKLIHKAGADVKNPERCAVHDMFSEELVVNKDNRGIKWALVSIGGNPKVHPDSAKAEGEVEFGQEFCHFIPHLLAMREGQKLIVTASDPGLGHNTNLSGGVNPVWNVVIPPPKEGEKSAVDGPDLRAVRQPMPVRCDIHKWMNAHIAVFKHPYFAVTGDDGSFEIKNVPAGKQKLVVWQELILWGPGGQTGQDIEVKPDETTDVRQIMLVKQ